MKPVTYSNLRFTNIINGNDGLTLEGPYDIRYSTDKPTEYKYNPNKPFEYLIENCVFDNTGVDPKDADEAISLIFGACAVIRNSRITNWGKAILAGNGDAPAKIDNKMTLVIENCIFDGNSRRHPFFRHGTLVMRNCLIRNWGKTFHEKSHGVRISGSANVTIENCVFWQDNFIQTNYKNFFIDCCNQVLDWRIWNFLYPGACRGVYTEDGDNLVSVKNCYTNKWWVNMMHDSRSSHMSKKDALELIEHLERTVPR